MQNSLRPWADRSFIPLLLLITLASLLVRVVPLHDRVITPDAVRFQSVDPYYHVRLSKYLTEHFPHRLEYDSLRLHPGGQRVDVYPAYDFVNAFLALIAGLGSPSERTTEEAIAWSPPLLGAATVTFVGLAARLFAGPWGGLAAAVVAGTLPGGTLSQSVIGMSDHHAMETFFLAAAWWILTLLLVPDGTTKQRLLLAAALGVTAGGYALTWEGSPVLPTVIGLCTAIMTFAHAADPQFQIRTASEAGLTAATAVLLAWAARFWSPMITVSVMLLLFGALLPLAMILAQRMFGISSVQRLRIAWLSSIVIVGVVLIIALPSSLLSSLVTNLGRFDPSEKARTVSELRPLFEEPAFLWNYFGTSLAWAAVGGVLAVIVLLRRRSATFLVPFLTGLIFVPAALMQIRFASAASLPLALLCGVLVGEILHGMRAEKGKRRLVRSLAYGTVLTAWIVSVPVWSAGNAISIAAVDRGPSIDWISVTTWLKEHARHRSGVLNWWDSGYYLTTLAGQAPVSNPSQAGARRAADAFLDTTGERGVHGLALESIRYIIAEAGLSIRPTATTSIAGQFPALPIWSGIAQETYVREVVFPDPKGGFVPRFAYLPAYYRTLLVRLLLADGEAVNPNPRAAWAIQLEPRIDVTGRTVDMVRSSRSFADAAGAESFMKYEGDSTWLIVGFSPFEPCVPLEPVRNVRLVHASPTVALSHPTLRQPIAALKVYSIEER